ncbi:MAG: T9SS type A sorting domain-containing protein [Bacteroidota bacterium]
MSTPSGPDTLYSLRPSNDSEPTRYYRGLEDAIQAFDLWGFGGGSTPAELFVAGVTTSTSPQIAAYVTDLTNQNRWTVDPQLRGISRTDAGGGITSAEPGHAGEIPAEYALEQNYPNPFNPSTTIRFGVPARDFVTLKIYTILGEEVAALVSADMVPGTYQTTFDASRLASGMYIYRLQTNTFTQSQKVMLVK